MLYIFHISVADFTSKLFKMFKKILNFILIVFADTTIWNGTKTSSRSSTTLAITWQRRHYGSSRSRSNHETSGGAEQSARRRPRTWNLEPQRQFTVRPEPPAEPREPTLEFWSWNGLNRHMQAPISTNKLRHWQYFSLTPEGNPDAV